MNICAEDRSDNYTIQWTIPSGTMVMRFQRYMKKAVVMRFQRYMKKAERGLVVNIAPADLQAASSVPARRLFSSAVLTVHAMFHQEHEAIQKEKETYQYDKALHSIDETIRKKGEFNRFFNII